MTTWLENAGLPVVLTSEETRTLFEETNDVAVSAEVSFSSPSLAL